MMPFPHVPTGGAVAVEVGVSGNDVGVAAGVWL